MELWEQRNWIEHTQVLLDSYRHWVGSDLIMRATSPKEDARALYTAPMVVVSHGTEADPVLNYGNQTALNLWQMDAASLCQTPSRMTAEPMHRDERQRLLERTSQAGFVDDYSGIRISNIGQRFFIPRATVWNLIDANGERVGQAATFSEWRLL